MAAGRVRTTWDEGAVRALSQPQGAVFQQVYQVGNRVLNRAKALCPVDEGRLRASLTLQMEVRGNTVVAIVGSNLDYALWVHEGTGIYAGRGYITPKRGTFLRWPAKNNSGAGARRYSGGKTSAYVFARRVKGIKGRPFLTDALAQTV